MNKDQTTKLFDMQNYILIHLTQLYAVASRKEEWCNHAIISLIKSTKNKREPKSQILSSFQWKFPPLNVPCMRKVKSSQQKCDTVWIME